MASRVEAPPSKESPNYKPFTDVFIANRGISALLAGRVCKAKGIRPYFAYSFTDPYTEATRMADENASLGWQTVPIGGTSPAESYSNVEMLLETARILRKEAKNPEGFGVYFGWGFKSEGAETMRRFEEEGFRLVGPPSSAIERLGNKMEARKLAQEIGIPTVKGSGSITTPEQAIAAAKEISFPVMLKDPEGGGGKDIVVAHNEEEVLRGFQQLRSNEGNREIFLEKYIENSAHIEVQLVADQYGNVVSLGHRDCTMQRRFQKFIEESPSPRKALAQKIEAAAVALGRAAGYQTVGTAEFILDMDHIDENGDPAWSFMEFNTRLQVENRVTELVTGLNVPNLLFDTASGLALPFTQAQVVTEGHAIQARVYAEDPYNGFTQTPGKIEELVIPQIHGVIADSAYRSGDTISAEFDPTLLHGLSRGSTREEAIALLQRFLSQLRIRGDEVTTNIPFLLKMLESERFRKGTATTTSSERTWGDELRRRVSDVVAEFAAGGEFTPFEPSLQFDPSRLPMDMLIPSRDPKEKPVKFSKRYQEAQQRTGRDSAAEYGIIKRDGIEIVLYRIGYNDFRNGGPFGQAEGNTFTDAAQLSSERNLYLLSHTPSGGIDQPQNMSGLIHLPGIIDDADYYPSPFHAHVIDGYELGGVPLVFSEIADVLIGIDNPNVDPRIGITGPFMTYMSMHGVPPPSDRAADIYRELGDVHSVQRASRERNIHLILPNLGAASDLVTHIAYILGESGAQDSVRVFRPKENIGSHETSRPIATPEAPDFPSRAWLGPRIGSLWEHVQQGVEHIIYHGEERPLRTSERLDIIEQGLRPHAADIIDTRSGFLDDAVLLATHFQQANGTDVYPSTIAALGRIEEFPVLILAHQSRRVRNPETGEFEKLPSTPRAQDIAYLIDMIDKIGAPRHLPIITLGDTEGLSSTDKDEDRNIVRAPGTLMRRLRNYRGAVIPIGIGMEGSGGGAKLLFPGNRSAWAKNAVGFVSHPRVNYRIQTGSKWIDKNSPENDKRELRRFVDQFEDAKAEVVRDKLKQIDEVLDEGPGGAHLNPRVLPAEIRRFVLKSLRALASYTEEELIEERHDRLRIARITASRPRPVR